MRPVGTAGELERRRRRAVELVKHGESPDDVAHFLGCGRSSVYTWLKLDRNCPERLAAKPHPGPAPRLSDAQLKELEALLLEGAKAPGRSPAGRGEGAGTAAAGGGQGPRLAHTAVARQPGRRADRAALRHPLPP